MARRQKKTDEKKNELYKEKKKIVEENVALKKELKILYSCGMSEKSDHNDS